MPCGRAVDGHLSVQRGDAAVKDPITHNRPFAACVARNLNHGATMGGHLDINQLFGHAGKALLVLTAKAGEHHLFVGVFVVHTEQATGAFGIEGGKAHIVVVIAKLLQLGFGGLVHHVKFGGLGGDRVTPTQQYIGLIALGDVMGLIITPGQLVEAIAAFRRCRCGGAVGGDQRRGAKQGGGSGDTQHAAQHVATAIAGIDDVPNGSLQVWIGRDIVKGLIGFGFVADFRVVDDVLAIHGLLSLSKHYARKLPADTAGCGGLV